MDRGESQGCGKRKIKRFIFVENRRKFCYNIFCMFASKCKGCIIKIIKTQIDKTEHMF